MTTLLATADGADSVAHLSFHWPSRNRNSTRYGHNPRSNDTYNRRGHTSGSGHLGSASGQVVRVANSIRDVPQRRVALRYG